MQKTIHKNIILMLLIIVALFSVVFPIVGYAQSNIAFDNISVMDDLLTSKDFNVYHFGYKDNATPQLLNMAEYCFSPFSAERGNYGLYVYLYNPGNIKFNSDNNYIQLSTTNGATKSDYNKYQIKLLSSSKGDYDNLYHKFKIIGASEIVKQVNSSKRIYNISSIELNTVKSGVIDYGTGGQYSYTGYSKGYGPDTTAETNLSYTVKDIERIRLKPESTFYRLAGENSNGYQDNLSSVYFSVNNSILKEYGSLSGIHASWDEFHTAPMLVVNRDDIYNSILNATGVNIGSGSNSSICEYAFYTKGVGGYQKAWNYPYPSSINTNSIHNLTTVFKTTKSLVNENEQKTLIIPNEDILNYWASFDKSFDTGRTPGGKYSMDLFQTSVDSGRSNKFDDWIRDTDTWKLQTYTFDNGWDKYWKQLFGKPGIPNSISGINPIYQVKASDVVSTNKYEKLFINENDFSKFEKYYTNSTLSGKSTFLFRFAVTDYKVNSVQFAKSSNGSVVGTAFSNYGIITEQTAFLNFDILELEFNKDGKFIKIPVVMNPIDIVGGITPGYKPEGNDLAKWLIILATIIFVIWLLNVTGVLPYVMKAIGAPFRFVGNLFKKNKGGSNNVTIYTSGEIKANENTKKKVKERLKHDKSKKD